MSVEGIFKTMPSRITGKLQTYVLTEQLVTCERFTADMGGVKTRLQYELDRGEVDAQVESCRQIRAYRYDYLVTNVWCPAASPIPAAVVVFLAKAIIIVLTWAGIVAVTYFALVGFKEQLFPTPKYWCPYCGAGPFSSVTELTAHIIKEHPGLPRYVCPYCGQVFETAEQLNEHMKECPWKPAEIPTWVPWVIAGIALVGAIIIIPKIIEIIWPKKA
jgi:hypothetical protein